MIGQCIRFWSSDPVDPMPLENNLEIYSGEGRRGGTFQFRSSCLKSGSVPFSAAQARGAMGLGLLMSAEAHHISSHTTNLQKPALTLRAHIVSSLTRARAPGFARRRAACNVCM